MAARVTVDEVKRIMDTALTVEQIAPFVDVAHGIVEAAYGSSDKTDDELRRMELLCSAWAAVARDPIVVEETTGKSKTRYASDTGLGLNSNQYGQMLLLLDDEGKLADMVASKGSATIEHIGVPE